MIENISEIRNKGYQALTRELGAAGTAMFLRQIYNGSGNYTEERRAILDATPVDEIMKRIQERNQEEL